MIAKIGDPAVDTLQYKKQPARHLLVFMLPANFFGVKKEISV